MHQVPESSAPSWLWFFVVMGHPLGVLILWCLQRLWRALQRAIRLVILEAIFYVMYTPILLLTTITIIPPPPCPSTALAESSDLEIGSEIDSGGRLDSSSSAPSSSGGEDFLSSSDGDELYSTDVSDTRLRRVLDSDSDEFSTDVSESRKRRRGGGF